MQPLNFNVLFCSWLIVSTVGESDSKTSKYSELFFHNSAQFITTLVKNKMNNCDLVFAHDNHPLYFSEIQKMSAKLVSLNNMGGSYVINIWKNFPFNRFEDIHTKSVSGGCSVVVLMIHQIKSGIYSELFELLTPHYGSITRKDEDYFLFFGALQFTDQFLLSEQFGNKIKYKIALEEDLNSKGKMVFKTGHFYKDFGKPKLINLNLAQGNDTDLLTIFPDMTKNLYGRIMKLSCPNVPARLEIAEQGNGKFRIKRGYFKYWLDLAMNKWNFTTEVFYSSFGKGTGAKLPNGTWTGGLGDVFHGKADFAFSVAHIYSRHKLVEWSAPLSSEKMVFLCHKPQTGFSALAIFWPFPRIMWFLFFLAILINIILIRLLIRAKRDDSNFAKKWSINKISFYAYASLLEQAPSSPSELPYDPVRIFCIFWLLFSCIVTCAYRAKLVSLIAFPVSSWVPETFEELAYSNFKVGLNTVGKGDAAYIRFSTSTSPLIQKMFKKMEIDSNPLNGIQRAVKEKICFIMWEGIGEYLAVRNISDKHGRSPLQTSTSSTFFIHAPFVWEKRAIFRAHFDRSMWNQISMGINLKWKDMDFTDVRLARNKWEKSENISERILKEIDGPQKLQIVHCFGALAILLCGIIISTILFIFELIRFRILKRKEVQHLTNNNEN